ncbi:MAG: adenylyltransferase/cytidyltransferase family protein [Candidatus Altiarchaeales archaeon]|nr:adenylyltransferase/cytidyltransferase family protein [Candidatus Altiarchaeales archaeon]
MKTVVATGVFDLLHPGHIFYLNNAKQLGDRLVVVVASDETVKKRNKKALVREKQRLEVVGALKPVDDVVLGGESEHRFLEVIHQINPQIIALGPDQEFDENTLRGRLLEHGVNAKIIRIKKRWKGQLNSSKKMREKAKSV